MRRKNKALLREKLEKKNQHINFEREGKKSNSRKTPTKLVCVKCGKIFTLPFKPRRPEIYCDDCFKKKNDREKRISNSENKNELKKVAKKSGSFKEFVKKTH